MIYGPDFKYPINRIQPIDSDLNDTDQRGGNKKRRVLYQGRSWGEREEDLPRTLKPSTQVNEKDASGRVYPDRVLMERAQKIFKSLMMLEEKVAQLCFLETSAIYDASLQDDVELLIQTWQIGGILFKNGSYKRQGYLIDRYQEISKTPLLMANDFLHGLSFYLQEDALPKQSLSEQRCSDLGKAVMALNRRIGVHVQFDREREAQSLPLNERQAKMFRKGVRKAQGIVGKKELNKNEWMTLNSALPFMSQNPSALLKHHVREIIGLKTLAIFDATTIKDALEKELIVAFKKQYDVFLLSKNMTEAIRIICKLIRLGKIREEDLDRHVMKILIIKSLFLNKHKTQVYGVTI